MKNILFLLAVIILLIPACKKDADTKADIPKVKRFISSWPAPIEADTMDYTYDDEGRLITQYYNGQIFASYSYEGNVVYESDTRYNLNNEGNAIERKFDGGNGQYVTNVLTYNTSGQLLTDGEDEFTWQDDNMTLQSTYIDYIFTYSDEKNTIGQQNRGIMFLGKDSKNLIASRKLAGQNSVEEYTYEFDDKGRVAKLFIGSQTQIYTYY